MERMTHIFIGKKGKYQIPNGTKVRLIKCYAKRKCKVRLEDDTEHITMVSLLRRIYGELHNSIRQAGEGKEMTEKEFKQSPFYDFHIKQFELSMRKLVRAIEKSFIKSKGGDELKGKGKDMKMPKGKGKCK